MWPTIVRSTASFSLWLVTRHWNGGAGGFSILTITDGVAQPEDRTLGSLSTIVFTIIEYPEAQCSQISLAPAIPLLSPDLIFSIDNLRSNILMPRTIKPFASLADAVAPPPQTTATMLTNSQKAKASVIYLLW